ncbi:MAG: division/cell wall cluster transcriptional repressor MraZ [Parcubacteria group bacterium]|nr:division/cell wall cluster transcriptional repressor MraZ [Parcubacteria group bacterium]
MLIGEYKHIIDTKKRLSLPAKFRKELGKNIVITKGLDTCLFIYSPKNFQRFLERLKELSVGKSDTRRFNRFVLGGAVDSQIDSLGRILVPDFLKEFAELKNTVVLIGVNDRVEIWDENNWNEYRTQSEKEADILAERLGEIGAL